MGCIGKTRYCRQPRSHQQCTWLIQERKEVEGSLFLIRRNEEPCIQIVILNKKSTREAHALVMWFPTHVLLHKFACLSAASCFSCCSDNYVEDIHPGFQFEKSRPYLLYRNKDEEVILLALAKQTSSNTVVIR